MRIFENKYFANIFLVSAIILAVLIAYSYSFSKLALTWQNSNTYGHGFLILPIVLWLINQKKYLLARTEIRTSATGLFFVGLTSLAWFISVLTYVNVIEQFVLYTLFIALTWAFFGWKVVWLLKFPLIFLYFSIPVGDFLIPYLQFITADISVYLIQILGIPVFRDGMYIQIPNGNFLVAEACSGIRFLISTVTMGVLFSYLNYTKLYKQILFVVICFIVAIVGNGLRAFLMILIGHLSDMEAAVGFDHLVYGWVFFSIILAVLFIIGSFMTDSESEAIHEDVRIVEQIFPTRSFILITCAALLIGPMLKLKYDQYINEMELKYNNKAKVDSNLPDLNWLPKFLSADEFFWLSENVGIGVVDTYIANYHFETDGKEIISYQNELFNLNLWSLKSLNSDKVTNGKVSIPFTKYIIVNLKGERREIRVTYQVNNQLFASKVNFKIKQLLNKVMMRDFGGRVIVLSSKANNANEILNQFMLQNFSNNKQQSILLQRMNK